MTLNRWAKRSVIIDYTCNTAEEVMFVAHWLREHHVKYTTAALGPNECLFLTTMYNFQAARFFIDMEDYHATSKKLDEMEAYENEH